MRPKRPTALPTILKIALILLAFVAGSRAAWAEPGGAARAYGEKVNVSLKPLLGLKLQVSSGPLPVSEGVLQPAFLGDSSLASASVSLGPAGELLRTGLLVNRVTGAEEGQVSARSTVDQLRVSLGSLLTLRADAVGSRAEIRGSCGEPLIPVGSSSLTRGGTGGLLGLGLSLPLSVPPNTVLVNLLGVKVVLNEQTLEGDGLTSLSLAVNAVHVSLQNSLLAGIGGLSGDVVVAHSEVSRQCDIAEVPGLEADLELDVRSEGSRVEEGSALTLELRVTSYGPEEAPSVVLADVLPAGADVVEAIPSQGTCTVSDVLTCDLGSLTPGVRASVRLTLQPHHTGQVVYQWSAASALADPDPSNNGARMVVTVNAP